MTEKLQQTIKEEIMKLPNEAQKAINSLDWVKITEDIGKKYLLSEQEINTLQAETLTVLIGLTYFEEYVVDIENEIGTPKDDAEKIVVEANEKIFTPIYDKLVEDIKENLKFKKPTPEQNLNFILSGGDYSVFLDQIAGEVSK